MWKGIHAYSACKIKDKTYPNLEMRQVTQRGKVGYFINQFIWKVHEKSLLLLKIPNYVVASYVKKILARLVEKS